MMSRYVYFCERAALRGAPGYRAPRAWLMSAASAALLLGACTATTAGPSQSEPAGPNTVGGAAPAAVPPAPAREPRDPGVYVAFEPGPGRFALAAGSVAASLVLNTGETPGVQRAAR